MMTPGNVKEESRNYWKTKKGFAESMRNKRDVFGKFDIPELPQLIFVSAIRSVRSKLTLYDFSAN